MSTAAPELRDEWIECTCGPPRLCSTLRKRHAVRCETSSGRVRSTWQCSPHAVGTRRGSEESGSGAAGQVERVHLGVAAGRVWLAAAADSCNAETDPEASANQLPRRVWRLSAVPPTSTAGYQRPHAPPPHPARACGSRWYGTDTSTPLQTAIHRSGTVFKASAIEFGKSQISEFRCIPQKLTDTSGVFRRNLPTLKNAYVIRNPEVISGIYLTICEIM